MSDPNIVVDTVDEAPKAGLQSTFFDSLDDLLKKLVPESDVVIKDCWGKEITLPSALPARRQIKVFRLFKEISEMEQVSDIFEGRGGDASEIIDVIIELAGNDDISEKLGQAFTLAHPDALDGKDPLDVLPIEEIVAALVPFLMRFLQRSMGAMGAMTEIVPQA
jgi:hypothetical protein